MPRRQQAAPIAYWPPGESCVLLMPSWFRSGIEYQHRKPQTCWHRPR
jgi:hypothetical protein